jgi:hypothetical protein
MNIKENIKMSKKDKEVKIEPEQPANTLQTLFKFEDLTISKRGIYQQEGSMASCSYNIVIQKESGGISDSTYNLGASGVTKNWQLFSEDGCEIVLGEPAPHGNRALLWEGPLNNGLYILTTGPSHNYSKRRIAGRGYKITFRV